MGHKYYQGLFQPSNPRKYFGDVKNITYRSSWERRVMAYLDESDSILAWNSEELVVPYISPLDNQKHRYFPDFLVKAKTRTGVRTMMWEVKPHIQSIPPPPPKRITRRYITEVARYGVNQAKWDAAKAFCATKGWEFIVLTEKDLFGSSAKYPYGQDNKSTAT